MTERPTTPKRNWAADVLVVAGVWILVTTTLNGGMRAIPDFPTTYFGTVFGLQFAGFFLVPVAALVAFIALGVGGNGMLPLGGYSTRARLLFLGTGLFAMAAQYSLLGSFLTYATGGESEVPERVTTIVLIALAGAFAIATSVVVFRAGVVRGLARWALPLATLLVVASVVMSNLVTSDWSDIPHGLALVILGIAYWRVGLIPRLAVPERPESLAE